MNTTIYKATQVFTPSVPAKISFVERDSINEKLVNSINTPGKQIVIFGHSGCGKSTVLDNKLQQLYEGHITSRCMKGTTIESLMRDAFDQLDVYFTQEKTNATKSTLEVNLEATYWGLKNQLKSTSVVESSNKQIRLIPPDLTPNLLAKLLGIRSLCWVLEDFHKVDEDEKPKLSQFMKIFMDCGSDYPEVKIIAIGAVETARQVVEYDPEMKNRVAEIEVPLMSEAEIKSIISKGADALNLVIPEKVQQVISKYSSGLAAVCHQLCLNMCMAANVNYTSETRVNITIDHLEKAIKTYVEECSDTIKSNFEKARKISRATVHKHADEILDALSSHLDVGASRGDILKSIQRRIPAYTDSTLKKQLEYLLDLKRGGLVRYSHNSGLYSFSDPVYRVYAKTLFHSNGKVENGIDPDTLDLGQLVRLLEKELNKLRDPQGRRVAKTK